MRCETEISDRDILKPGWKMTCHNTCFHNSMNSAANSNISMGKSLKCMPESHRFGPDIKVSFLLLTIHKKKSWVHVATSVCHPWIRKPFRYFTRHSHRVRMFFSFNTCLCLHTSPPCSYQQPPKCLFPPAELPQETSHKLKLHLATFHQSRGFNPMR